MGNPFAVGGGRFGFPLGAGAQLHPEVLEKFRHQGGGFGLPDALFHRGMVIKAHVEQTANRANRAEFAVGRAVNHPGNPGVDDGAGAHGAGLQGHIQGAFPQPPATQAGAGFGNGFDFRVGQGGFALFPAVAAPTDDFVPPDNDAAHGHFPFRGGFGGQLQGFIHKIQIVHLILSFGFILPKKAGKVKEDVWWFGMIR